MISFLMGPMMWATFGIFLLGISYRIHRYIQLKSRQRKLSDFNYLPQKGHFPKEIEQKTFGERFFILRRSLRSLQPITLLNSIVFHVLLFVVPLFLSAHNILLDMSLGIHLPVMHDHTADILTVVMLFCCLYFFIRRIADKKVGAISTAGDFILLFMVILPFLTGFLAYHQVFDKKWVMLLHIISGQIMLLAVPFTKIIHMVVFFINRFPFNVGVHHKPGFFQPGNQGKMNGKPIS